MDRSFVSLLKCPCCNSEKLDVESFEDDNFGSIKDGRIVCVHCKQWYRIENSIVDLLSTELRDVHRYMSFAKKWSIDLDNIVAENIYHAQKKQIEYFKKESRNYDKGVDDSTFFTVSDKCCFFEWMSNIKPSDIVLDIGSGTGRQTLPLTESGNYVVSLDISEEMLRIAQDKSIKNGVANKIQFVLSDANKLPFKEQIFDAVLCYGLLHHCSSARNTIKESSRVLKQGGLWYSYDPHASPVRFIFDIAMKMKKLHNEVASDEPLFNSSELKEWCEECDLTVNIRYHTYILPHIINLFSENNAYKILQYTDKLFSNNPLFRSFAGLIITDGCKVGNVKAVKEKILQR